MALVKFNNRPFLPNLIDRFFDDDLGFFAGRDFNNNVPSVNIRENDEAFALEVAAPGLKKEHFKLDVDNSILTIAAEHKTKNEQNEDNYRRKEFGYTSFKRSFKLPKTVDGDAIKANYEDGVLHILIPKKEEAKPKRREIAVS